VPAGDGLAAEDGTAAKPDMLEHLESCQWLVMDALAHSDTDFLTLDFFGDITLSRDMCRELIAAYRQVNVAIYQRGGTGEAEIAAVLALHDRRGVLDPD
jgi:hypothetical protein